MYAGRIVEMASSEALFENPKHPYTQSLLSAVPHPDPDVPMKFELGGEVADAGKLPSGCSFHPRCRECFAPCDQKTPELLSMPDGTRVACHLHHG